jgi:hypothetical protein
LGEKEFKEFKDLQEFRMQAISLARGSAIS